MNLLSSPSNILKIITGTGILMWSAFHIWLLHSWFGLEHTFAVWDSIVTNITLSVAVLVMANVLLHYVPKTGKFGFAFLLSFLMAWLCLVIITHALLGVSDSDQMYEAFVYKSSPIRWAFSFVVIFGDGIASILYYQQLEQKKQSQYEATTESMIREAELQKLQLQLQPHFLFNCLNSVNAMVLSRPKEAQEMIQHLSDFLRVTLKRADEHWISFEDEWQYLQLYLSIEKVRFGHRLEIVTDFELDDNEGKIPALLLQPLAENAIKFGLYGTTEKVMIRISVALKEQLLQVTVSNPFDTDIQPPKGSGFGLNGMRRRLYLLFARNDLLETSISGNIFTVVLKIPQRHDQNDSN